MTWSLCLASLPFSLGALLYWIVNKNRFSYSSKTLAVFIYFVFLLNAIFSNSFNPTFKQVTLYLNLMVGLVLVLYLFSLKVSPRLKAIDNYIGNYSYPLYISHYTALSIYQLVFGSDNFISTKLNLSLNTVLSYSFILFSLCFLVVHLIDMKANKIKMKLTPKKI